MAGRIGGWGTPGLEEADQREFFCPQWHRKPPLPAVSFAYAKGAGAEEEETERNKNMVYSAPATSE